MIAAVVFGTLLGSYIHYDYVKWGQRGRDAFLAYQLHRFDKYMDPPHPAILSIISSIVLVVIVLAVYETSASILSRLLKSSGGRMNQ